MMIRLNFPLLGWLQNQSEHRARVVHEDAAKSGKVPFTARSRFSASCSLTTLGHTQRSLAVISASPDQEVTFKDALLPHVSLTGPLWDSWSQVSATPHTPLLYSTSLPLHGCISCFFGAACMDPGILASVSQPVPLAYSDN